MELGMLSEGQTNERAEYMRSHQAARFETALGVLGIHIARLSSAQAMEKVKAQPNQARLVLLEEEINRWTDEQDALRHQDTARIDQLLTGIE